MIPILSNMPPSEPTPYPSTRITTVCPLGNQRVDVLHFHVPKPNSPFAIMIRFLLGIKGHGSRCDLQPATTDHLQYIERTAFCRSQILLIDNVMLFPATNDCFRFGTACPRTRGLSRRPKVDCPATTTRNLARVRLCPKSYQSMSLHGF